VPAGVPIYVHLDAINSSLSDLEIDQDAWLYFTPLPWTARRDYGVSELTW
jgi:hypothetical protein